MFFGDPSAGDVVAYVAETMVRVARIMQRTALSLSFRRLTCKKALDGKMACFQAKASAAFAVLCFFAPCFLGTLNSRQRGQFANQDKAFVNHLLAQGSCGSGKQNVRAIPKAVMTAQSQ